MKSLHNKTSEAPQNLRPGAGRDREPVGPIHPYVYLQQTAGNQAVGRFLQAKLKVNAPGDEYEQEADQVADSLMRVPEGKAPGSSRTPPKIQRRAKETGSVSPPAAAPKESSASAMIAEDFAETLAPGQMKKSDFLAQLRGQVCKTADEALAGTDKSSKGCPYVESWFGFYSNKDSRHIERSLRKFAPETARAKSAGDYIPMIAARVRRSVERWAKTGEIAGVPEELLNAKPEAGLSGALEGSASGIGSAAGGLENGISALGSLFFKDRAGGPNGGGDPRAIQAQLGHGRQLDGNVRSRMEAAFGMNFSDVRLHADSSAGKLSESLNARAFTAGRHVAFGPGEYQPGTLIGDALIAHELAHVVQQRGGKSSDHVAQKGSPDHGALEEDADAAAVGAMVSAWQGTRAGLASLGKNAMPRLKSGLRLQRCKDGKKAEPKAEDPAKMTDAQIEATTEFKSYMDPKLAWQTKHKMTREEALLACRLLLRHKQEGNAVSWSTDAEVFMNLARKQLGTLTEAKGLIGKLEWVGFSTSTALSDPSKLDSDFGKWLLAGGPEPDAGTGKINCWEMVLFSAYKRGATSKKRLEDIYNEAVKQVKAGARTFVGDTIEIELRRGKEYVLDPTDPKSPEPLPGDIVIFTKAANHAAISLGTKDTFGLGRHKIVSHWPPPDGSYRVKETTIEELLGKMDPGNIVKFWSPEW